jgi:5-methyltetrahydropteroyltriglutamate--homocysteine methyltransferase
MAAVSDRILTTHAGSLPRPDDLADMIWARLEGKTVEEQALEARIDAAVAEVVDKQRTAGIDIVSDGEMSKTGFSTYVNERFSGFDGRSEFQADDVADFPNLAMRLFNTPSMAHIVFSNCVGPAELSDKQAVHRDIDRLKRALNGAEAGGAFMGAISPGQIAFNYPDQYYGSHEAYLGALADALSYEYKAITDAGLGLQIDSPDMAMAAHCRSVGSSVGDWHRHLPLAVDALNAALDGIRPNRSGCTSAGATTAVRTTRTCPSGRSSAKRCGSTPGRSTSRAPTLATHTSGECSSRSTFPMTSP